MRQFTRNSGIGDSKLTGYILICILIALVILAFRPFGFRTFLHGLEHNNILSLLLVISVIAICRYSAEQV
jgi:uncharacterized membrane protein